VGCLTEHPKRSTAGLSCSGGVLPRNDARRGSARRIRRRTTPSRLLSPKSRRGNRASTEIYSERVPVST